MLTIDEIKMFIDDDATSEKKMLAKKGLQYYEANHDIKDYRIFYYSIFWVISKFYMFEFYISF